MGCSSTADEQDSPMQGSGGAAPAGGTSSGGSDGSGSTATGGGSGGQAPLPERTLQIVFDYRFDDAGFFDPPERREALEDAAQIWTARLTDDFPARPADDMLLTVDPEDPYSEEPLYVTLEEEVDDLIIFTACSEDLTSQGLTSIMSGSTFFMVDENGEIILTPDDERFAASDYQPWVSSISFHCSENWSFDNSPETDDPPAGTVDFLSVAAHEIGHALGCAASVPAFAALIEDGNFVGPAATAAAGGPIAIDDGHFAEPGYLMSPLSATRFPSETEFGILTDLGYEVVPAN